MEKLLNNNKLIYNKIIEYINSSVITILLYHDNTNSINRYDYYY